MILHSMLLSGCRKLNLFVICVAQLERVIPLRLTGGDFAVYQQLPDEDERDSGKITKALRTAFAVDSFTAYEQFVTRPGRRWMCFWRSCVGSQFRSAD